MIRKSSIIFLFLLLSSIIIMIGADWVIDDYTVGQWQYKYDYQWRTKENADNAKVVFINNQSNFQEWSFGVTIDEWSCAGTWFWAHIFQVFNATFYDENGITNYQILIHHKWLLPNQFSTTLSLYENGTSVVRPIEAIALGYSMVYIWRNTSDILNIDLIYKESKTTNGSYVIRHFEQDVGSSFFANVQLEQTVKKDLYNGAVGFIKGTKHDEIIDSGAGTGLPHSEVEMSLGDKILWSIWHDLTLAGKVIYDLLPDAIKSVWDVTFGVLLNFIQFLLGTLAPNLLTYFAIYVTMIAVGCFLTATEIIGEEYEFGAGKEQTVIERVKGAFQPLFDLFIKMFEIGVRILQFVIDIIF